jgi:DNA-binding MarR family transcriptional regulator
MLWSMRVDRYDELVAARLGINRTDLRCLDLLHQGDTMTAGQLSADSGLTSGATTRMIDWLERPGTYDDCTTETTARRVLVELTPRARELATELYGSFEDAAAGLSRYRPTSSHCYATFSRGVAGCTSSRGRGCRRSRSGRKERSRPSWAVPCASAGLARPLGTASSVSLGSPAGCH